MITPAKTGNIKTVAVGVLFLLFAASAAVAADEIAVSVSLSPITIGLDEQASLQVTVTGSSQSLPEIQMPSLPAFEIYSQGHSSNISIVNGQVSSSVTTTFLIVPHKAGVYPIQGIAVVKDNKRYEGNAVTLTVLNKGQSTSPQLQQRAADTQGNARDYFLEAAVDKRNPYVNEQVTLTLRFYIGVQYYSSPELDEPTTTGFWTELLGNSTPYFQKINGRNYRVIERKYALFPTQTGELTIGRATISTTVAARAQRRDPFDMFGDLFPQGMKVSTHSESISINVRQLPQAGRPADFTGTVGRFAITADADKTEVEVNQPVTVKVRISGSGNVKSVGEPVIPDLVDFRVYRASSSENVAKDSDRMGGTKLFEEVFIPKRPGLLEIPALTFNYFDPSKGKYETATTRAMNITVKKPEGYVGSPDVPYASTGLTVGNEAQDIRYIKDSPGDLRRPGRIILLTPLYMAVNGVPVLILGGLIYARKRRERLATDIRYARSRSASRLARKRLAKARSLAKLDSAGEFYGELSLAVTSFIADKLNISPHGLTSARITELLKEKGAGEKLIADASGFLQTCDFARFAPASLTETDLTKALESAEQVMMQMEGLKYA
ncbi:MAG: BatD family protein [Candidatus Zixiibacteriota bacterium]